MLEHFKNEKAYKKSWDLRCKETLNYFRNELIKSKSIAVYGCGPSQTFENLLIAEKQELNIYSSDLVEWNDSVKTINLDVDDLGNDCEIGVLLGVLEFLKSPNDIFNKLSKSHKKIIISYTTVKHKKASVVDYENEIIERVNSRFINHLTLEELLQIADDRYILESSKRCKAFPSQILMCFTKR